MNIPKVEKEVLAVLVDEFGKSWPCDYIAVDKMPDKIAEQCNLAIGEVKRILVGFLELGLIAVETGRHGNSFWLSPKGYEMAGAEGFSA